MNWLASISQITVYPNAALVLAALLTLGLGAFYCLPPPQTPDRAMMGMACFLVQTPRWICLALALGVCVANGAITWPANRPLQYLAVFTVHALLGLGAICAGVLSLTETPGVPAWLMRVLALSTVVVPAIEIGLAALLVNADRPAIVSVLGTRRLITIAFSAFVLAVIAAASSGILACRLARQRGKGRAESAVEQRLRGEEVEQAIH